MSEVDRSMEQTLLPAFLEEAADSVPLIRAAIAGACVPESAQAALQEAYRLVHNIRTSAAAAGEHELSDVARSIEDDLDRHAYAGQPITSAEADRLSERLEAVEAGLLARYDASVASGASAAAPVVRADWAEDEDEDAADIPAELLEVFSSEAQDHLGVMAVALSRLAEAPDDSESLAEVRRSAHTLKGAAAMVGLRAISALSHRMEDLLGAIADGLVAPTPEVPRLLLAATDRLHAIVLGEAAPSTALPPDLAARFDELLGRPQLPVAHPSHRPAPARRRQAPAVAHAERRRAAAPDRRSGAERRSASQTVRVSVSRLDEIIGLQGEVIISRSAFEQQVAELGRQVAQLDASLDRLSRTWMRFEAESLAGGGAPMAARSNTQVPQAAADGPVPHGFDELEFDRYTEWHVLSRQLTEAAADLAEGQRQLHETLGATERESTRLRRSTQDLQDRLMRLRMVPISTLSARLDRIVRVTAEGAGKDAAFVLEGGDVSIDKPLLDRLADPLFHLLRNAIDHGVERPDVRAAAGKPERATVRVSARYEGSQALVEVIDDGAGLDHEAIRTKARRSGRLSRNRAAAATGEDLEALIFETGFSTRAEVTEVSGRGVGLDAVRAAVRELNGTIEVRTEAGAGTTFAIRLPLTLALARVVMVRSGDETFAVPVTSIEQVIRVGADHLAGQGQTLSLRSDDGEPPRDAVWLADAVSGQPSTLPTPLSGALLLKGGRRVALLVDELMDTREVVVRVLGRGLSGVPGLAGATVLADGRVVLILDAEGLLAVAPGSSAGRPDPPVATPQPSRQVRVLIVDDSVSVRHVLASLAARAGWAALQARDGMEALDLLTADASRPDVILSDIEMPKMDGFELTSAIRADPALHEIPIVLITSRSGEKHRTRAFDLGVDDYLVKPFQESDLVDLVGRLAGRAAPDERAGGHTSRRPALPLPT